MNYEKFHVADIQGPTPEPEFHDYTDIEGCNKHVDKHTSQARKPKLKVESAMHGDHAWKAGPYLSTKSANTPHDTKGSARKTLHTHRHNNSSAK